ncbi:MAG: hypothetical protein JST27_05505 [Bacteroidetes bacterium]|nr:hypothetical protein [Bacteroidota bacterium]
MNHEKLVSYPDNRNGLCRSCILMSIATLSCKKGDEITTKPLHSVTTTSKWLGNTGRYFNPSTGWCITVSGNCLGGVEIHAPRKITDIKVAINDGTLGTLLTNDPGYYADLTSPGDTITQHFINGIVNGTIFYGLRTDLSLPSNEILLIMGEELVSNTSYDVIMPIKDDL